MNKQELQIEIPKLPGERAERYRARVEYMTAGADRSLRDVAQKLHKSLTLVGRWSSQDNWTDLSASYDRTVYTIAARRSADEYAQQLAEHRKRAMDSASGLYTVAALLLQRMHKQITEIELTAATLSIVRSALQTSLDLEAHALGIDLLQERIEGQDGTE